MPNATKTNEEHAMFLCVSSRFSLVHARSFLSLVFSSLPIGDHHHRVPSAFISILSIVFLS